MMTMVVPNSKPSHGLDEAVADVGVRRDRVDHDPDQTNHLPWKSVELTLYDTLTSYQGAMVSFL